MFASTEKKRERPSNQHTLRWRELRSCHPQLLVYRLHELLVLLDDLIVSGSHRQLVQSLTLLVYLDYVRAETPNDLISLSPHSLLILIEFSQCLRPLLLYCPDLREHGSDSVSTKPQQMSDGTKRTV